MLRNIIILAYIFGLLTLSNISLGQIPKFKIQTIVIDPGHGGKDPGASKGKLKEKDIVLDVALRTGKLIKNQYPDVKVIYTRVKDEFVPLDKRADIANKNNADLFISLHVNSFKSEKVKGAETYILGPHRSSDNFNVAIKENSVILLEEDYTTKYEGFDPNSAESYIMFELIQHEFLEQSRVFANQVQNSFIKQDNRTSRGVRQAGFLVLRKTTMPSVLIELGFISNKAENLFLRNDEGRQNMAISIADAFTLYKGKVESRSNSAIVPKMQKQTHTVIKDSIVDIYNVVKESSWYAIQIAASKTKLNSGCLLFKDEYPIFHLYENGYFKYYKCITNNIDEHIKNKQNLNSKFKGAFPVCFVNGKKEKFKIISDM